MATTITNLTGSGKVKDDSVISFTYSEDVTSLEPSSLDGGVGQVSFSALLIEDNKVGNTHPASKLLINNDVLLENDRLGSVQFQVDKLSLGTEVVSATGSTVHERLNVDKVAGPVGGTGATAWTAIVYYCSLVGITPDIEESLFEELDAIPVNFIGWQGNVWEHLKMLCAAISLSETDNVGFEMFIENNTLKFRKALQRTIDISDKLSSVDLSISSIDTAKSVTVKQYKTEYGVNRVVFEQDRSELTGKTLNATTSDSMSVEAGETLVKRFKINASLEEVNQPQIVSEISPLPYPLEGTFGQYVIVGNDDLRVLPEQWIDQGGSLEVRLTENPNEIELIIVAPPAPSLPLADDPSKFTLAPYKIGVESSGLAEYPAIYITGTGVFFENKDRTFYSGASDQYTTKDEGVEIDNPFLIRDSDTFIRGVAAAQAQCGPAIELRMSVSEGLQFGSDIGSVIDYQHNKYRISSIEFSPDELNFAAKGCARFSDFNPIWSGKTFANFTSVAFNPAVLPEEALSFNEFSSIPLMEAQ